MGVVSLTIHKMLAGKASEMHVWGHSSSAMACTQFETKKGTSTEAEHLFGMWKVYMYIHFTVLELCVSKRKKERRRKKMNKIEIFKFGFFKLVKG